MSYAGLAGTGPLLEACGAAFPADGNFVGLARLFSRAPGQASVLGHAALRDRPLGDEGTMLATAARAASRAHA